MPVYHSKFNGEAGLKEACKCALLPIKTTVKGPAVQCPPGACSENGIVSQMEAVSLASVISPLADQEDVIDEAIFLFRANLFFKKFDIEGPADRVLMYLTVYIQACLKKLEKCPNQQQAEKDMQTFSLQSVFVGLLVLFGSAAVLPTLRTDFAVPGDANFPFGGHFGAPKGKDEAEQWKAYFKQLREETGKRLAAKVFANGEPSKFWLCFGKRNFMKLRRRLEHDFFDFAESASSHRQDVCRPARTTSIN